MITTYILHNNRLGSEREHWFVTLSPGGWPNAKRLLEARGFVVLGVTDDTIQWFEKPHTVATHLPEALAPTKNGCPYPRMDGDVVIESLSVVITKQEARQLLDAWTTADSGDLLDEGTFSYDALFEKAERGGAL